MKVRHCLECGALLPDTITGGLCSVCAINGALGVGAKDTLVQTQSFATQPAPLTRGVKVRYFGDYELLEEIARGGMGVVYKARQTSLNRIVAVKMILAGRLASEAEVKRFHKEAEAAGNLQHSNIVAIHEVGEHEGQHYFSMDYVEGQNLAEFIRVNPLPVASAAQLVKTLAEAIHFAHQRGTLHRDLKPQNVLIDREGQPRITDFGLAKRVQEESGLTGSGTVLGSPSYMPPEQAAGRQSEIGPASDVYALGAIFYEMLTGRAPFKGDSSWATMDQVLSDEPVAPSKLNPNVPADLATICLKCLEKRPERRYPTARELAEELERFLNEEPILARPPNRLRQAWSWLVRHPWALTGAVSMFGLGLIGLAYWLWEQNRFLVWSRTHAAPDGLASAAFTTRLRSWWLLGFISLCVPPLEFADLVERKRRGMPFRAHHYWIYGSIGVLEMLGALALTLSGIHAYVWQAFAKAEQIGVLVFLVIELAWFGALLLWHLARQLRQATFAREDPRERTWFPPTSPKPVSLSFRTVTQREQHNRVYFAFLFILAASTLLLPSAGIRPNFMMAVFAAAIPLLLAEYGKTKSANRHLFLFGGLFCLSCLLLVVVPSSTADNLVGLSLGLGAGSLAARLNQRTKPARPAEDLPEKADLPWVKSHSTLCGWFLSILFGVLIVVFSGHALPLPPEQRHKFILLPILTFLCFLLPYEITCWLRAEGAERRARGWTLALNLTLASTILFSPPFDYRRWSVLIAMGCGGLVLWFIYVRSHSDNSLAPPTG